jgi:transcriptional regulator of arginine metabolism
MKAGAELSKISKARRQAIIRQVLRDHMIQSQGELAHYLDREHGIEVTQATLSRDLAEMGVVRVSRELGPVYEIEAPNVQSSPQLYDLGENILSLGDNELLVVLRTRPGTASAVALAIDTARLSDCLGTLAGDDTIFATPTRGSSTRRLAQAIQNLFGREFP